MGIESQSSEMSNGIELANGTDGFGYVRSSNPAVQVLERAIADVAPTNIPVLLTGESGTGKELFAQQIHRLSARRDQPVLKIICASLTSESFASHFGRAYDGASGNGKKGPGTLFFEEISELDTVSQRNLLYALPDGDARPPEFFLSARIISSSSRNLEEEMRAGRFRNELYYRINGACLRLPPLRQRKEDIPALVDFFLTKHSALLGRPRPSLSAHSMTLLRDHSWPGNIRELENVVKKIVALGEQHLGLADFAPAHVESRPALTVTKGSPLKAAARAASHHAERQLILEALARTRWNRKRAAQELQISYKSLLYKLKQIGADEPENA